MKKFPLDFSKETNFLLKQINSISHQQVIDRAEEIVAALRTGLVNDPTYFASRGGIRAKFTVILDRETALDALAYNYLLKYSDPSREDDVFDMSNDENPLEVTIMAAWNNKDIPLLNQQEQSA